MSATNRKLSALASKFTDSTEACLPFVRIQLCKHQKNKRVFSTMAAKMDDYHPGIACSYCKAKPIKSARYTCLVCNNHNLCEKCFSLKRVFGVHQSYHPTQQVLPKTQQLQTALTSKPDSSCIYCCPFCGDQGFTAKALVTHVDRLHFHDRKLVHCPICTVHQVSPKGIYGRQCDLLVHFFGVHQEVQEVSQCNVCSTSLIRYGCLVCENYQLCSGCRQNKSYTKSHRPYHPMQQIPLITANKSNVEEQLLVCPYCGKDDYTALLLANHCSRQHSSDTTAVRCPICVVRRVPGGFNTLINSKEPGQLRKHLQVVHQSAIIDEECSICMDKLVATSSKSLHCGHNFHAKCITQWLNGHNSCPICRKIVAVK